MGAKQSREEFPSRKDSLEPNGQVQARAIARGRVYVLVHYPREVESAQGVQIADSSFSQLLGELQKVQVTGWGRQGPSTLGNYTCRFCEVLLGIFSGNHTCRCS